MLTEAHKAKVPTQGYQVGKEKVPNWQGRTSGCHMVGCSSGLYKLPGNSAPFLCLPQVL